MTANYYKKNSNTELETYDEKKDLSEVITFEDGIFKGRYVIG